MSSSIHYKFRSMIEEKIISFNGNSIAVPELIELIRVAEKISTEMFDLKLSKPTDVEYELTDTVPKNSTVIIKRAPAQNGKKAPKTSNAEFSTGKNGNSPKNVAHISETDFAKMSEADRIQHAMRQSTYKYDPSSYSRPTKKANKEAPESFQCQRCYQFGHFPNNCPLANVRKTTGIPDSELIETTADDADRMLHNNGKWYITKMIMRAREQKKEREEQRRRGIVPQSRPPSAAENVIEPPADLKCTICNALFKEAVILQCCGDSFCGDCIFEQVKNAALTEDATTSLCPLCQTPVGINDLIPNETLRKSVEAFKKDPHSLTPSSASETTSNASSPPHDTSESVPSKDLTPPPPVKKEEPLRLPTVNLCHLFQPKPVAAPPTIPAPQIFPVPLSGTSKVVPKEVTPPSPVSSATSECIDEEPMKFDARDLKNIEIAWSLVPTFDHEIDLIDLICGDKMPKLVYEADEKENRRESRKRRHADDDRRKSSKKSKKTHYY